MMDYHAMGAENMGVLRACLRAKKLVDPNSTYFIESYGCQMNEHDSGRLAGMLELMGYTRAEDKAKADFILFNTCCVREHAEKRVFGNVGALKKIKEERPWLIIAVCGCMTQQEEIANWLYTRFPFVDIVFGTHEIMKFPMFVQKAIQDQRVLSVSEMDDDIPEGMPYVRQSSFSAYVTIMYGCNNFCSYCVVPYVRGRERSRTPENILNEVRMLAERGYKEITLLGQNVNSYSAEGKDFADILREVNEVDDIERIRFMTSHPKDLSERLIDAMAGLGKVCNHIHLPVQSGSDRILGLMNRRYDSARYLELVDKLRARVKGVELTTDIIVGFPTETDDDFKATLDIVRKAGFSAAYTFMYSPRKHTKAAIMEGQISDEIKKARLAELNDVCAETLKAGSARFIGTRGRCLVEGCDLRDGLRAYGKLPNFKMVYFEGDESMIGKLVDVEITEIVNNSLGGKIIC